METILADMSMAVDHLDAALRRLYQVKLQDPEQLDRLTSVREELNRLLVEMEDQEEEKYARR